MSNIMTNSTFTCNVSNGRSYLFSPTSKCSQDLLDIIGEIVNILIQDKELIPLYSSVIKKCQTKPIFDAKFETFYGFEREICNSPEDVKDKLKELVLKFANTSQDYENDRGKIVECYVDRVITNYYSAIEKFPLSSTYESELKVAYSNDEISTYPKRIDICSVVDNMKGEYFECKCLLNTSSTKDSDKVIKITGVSQLLDKSQTDIKHSHRLHIVVFYADEPKLNFYKNCWPNAPVITVENFNQMFPS
jgi:hypothetical protein